MKEFCFYKTPNNRRIVGVSNAVNIPFSVNPRLAYAPYLLLMSMAVEVPTAWAAVPDVYKRQDRYHGILSD